MEAVVGSWKIDRSNTAEAEAFMKNVGMPDEIAKRHITRDYVVSYKVEGNKLDWHVKVTNDPNLGERHDVLELGTEKDCTGLDNEKLKVLTKFEGGKFVERYQDLGSGGVYDVVREINGDVMTVTTSAKDQSYTQKWLRC